MLKQIKSLSLVLVVMCGMITVGCSGTNEYEEQKEAKIKWEEERNDYYHNGISNLYYNYFTIDDEGFKLTVINENEDLSYEVYFEFDIVYEDGYVYHAIGQTDYVIGGNDEHLMYARPGENEFYLYRHEEYIGSDGQGMIANTHGKIVAIENLRTRDFTVRETYHEEYNTWYRIPTEDLVQFDVIEGKGYLVDRID